MCAGIAAFLSYSTSSNSNLFFYQLFYNFGRILSYVMLGFFSGILSFSFFGLFSRFILILFSNVILILIGLYLSKLFLFMDKFERVGFLFWNKLYPITKNLIPIKNPFYGFCLGIFWGYIPCGLVYSSLLLSLSFFSIKKSMLFMFFFGLGTIPSMLFAGLLPKSMYKFIKNDFVKNFLGVIFIIIGLFNIITINDNCL